MEDDIDKLLKLVGSENSESQNESEEQNVSESDKIDETDDSDVFIDPESVSMAVEFSKRYTRLLIEKKNVAQSVKDLKKEYDEQGLPTSIVMKAFARLKSEKKETNLDEIKAFKKYMSQNNEIMELINELNS